MIPVSDEELVAPTMAGFGTPEVPLDGSRFEAYRFPAPTCPEYAEAVAPRPVPSASNMTTAELANAMEVLSLLNQSGRLQQMVQQIEHHEGLFTNAPQTHESGTTSSSTFCAGAYPWGKTAKALPTRGEGWPSVLRAYKTPIFAKGQKLTHSPAHEEKHAGQEDHYTTHPTYSGTILVGKHFCNWLKPPLRITTPTHTLYWVLLEVKS